MSNGNGRIAHYRRDSKAPGLTPGARFTKIQIFE